MKRNNQRAKHRLHRAVRKALKNAELSTATLSEIEGMPDDVLGALFKQHILLFQMEACRRPRASKSHLIAAAHPDTALMKRNAGRHRRANVLRGVATTHQWQAPLSGLGRRRRGEHDHTL